MLQIASQYFQHPIFLTASTVTLLSLLLDCPFPPSLAQKFLFIFLNTLHMRLHEDFPGVLAPSSGRLQHFFLCMYFMYRIYQNSLDRGPIVRVVKQMGSGAQSCGSNPCCATYYLYDPCQLLTHFKPQFSHP